MCIILNKYPDFIFMKQSNSPSLSCPLSTKLEYDNFLTWKKQTIDALKETKLKKYIMLILVENRWIN